MGTSAVLIRATGVVEMYIIQLGRASCYGCPSGAAVILQGLTTLPNSKYCLANPTCWRCPRLVEPAGGGLWYSASVQVD